MKNIADRTDISQEIELPNGDKVVLLGRLGTGDEYSKKETARNVFLVDAVGNVKWQIYSDFDEEGDPYTQLLLKNGLSAYRWDGGRYSVDLDTGAATPLLLER